MTVGSASAIADKAHSISVEALTRVSAVQQQMDGIEKKNDYQHQTLKAQNEELKKFTIAINRKLDDFRWWFMTGLLAVLFSLLLATMAIVWNNHTEGNDNGSVATVSR